MPAKASKSRHPSSQSKALARPARKPAAEVPLKLPRFQNKTRLDVGTDKLFCHGLFTVRKLLSEVEADSVIKAAEERGFKHQSSKGPAFGEAFRNNGRIAVHDPGFAQHLWQGTGLGRAVLEQVGGPAIGLNSNIRIYRYGPGQRFGKHIDEAVQIAPGQATQFTLLVYLNGGFENANSILPALQGGETVFYGGKAGREVARVVPEAGMALLHCHGQDCLEHEALPVTQGCKYILRSDVVFAT